MCAREKNKERKVKGPNRLRLPPSPFPSALQSHLRSVKLVVIVILGIAAEIGVLFVLQRNEAGVKKRPKRLIRRITPGDARLEDFVDLLR